MMHDDVPLICDPVPGLLPAPGVFLCDRKLSERQIAVLREQWKAADCAGRVMVLDRDVQFVSIFEPRQWPDAEFCAA